LHLWRHLVDDAEEWLCAWKVSVPYQIFGMRLERPTHILPNSLNIPLWIPLLICFAIATAWSNNIHP
jgi:hypothetical protein